MNESTALIDFRSGRGLRVNWDGTILVLRNELDKRWPWTVIHINETSMEYYVGQGLSDSHVEDWKKLTYLMS
jgi:hypothetical protein